MEPYSVTSEFRRWRLGDWKGYAAGARRGEGWSGGGGKREPKGAWGSKHLKQAVEQILPLSFWQNQNENMASNPKQLHRPSSVVIIGCNGPSGGKINFYRFHDYKIQSSGNQSLQQSLKSREILPTDTLILTFLPLKLFPLLSSLPKKVQFCLTKPACLFFPVTG